MRDVSKKTRCRGLIDDGIQSDINFALTEFCHWITEEEERESFAQVLLRGFWNCTTEQEEFEAYSQVFLSIYFHELPLNIIGKIWEVVWKE